MNLSLHNSDFLTFILHSLRTDRIFYSHLVTLALRFSTLGVALKGTTIVVLTAITAISLRALFLRWHGIRKKLKWWDLLISKYILSLWCKANFGPHFIIIQTYSSNMYYYILAGNPFCCIILFICTLNFNIFLLWRHFYYVRTLVSHLLYSYFDTHFIIE